jgi:hypothetical protein
MKSMKLPLLLVAFLLAIPFAGNTQSLNDEISLVQSAFGMNKRAAVEEYMALDEAMSAAFWPVYEAYEGERRSISADRIKIINDYLTKYETLSDADATDLMQRTLRNDIARAKLQTKYFKQFSKATSPMLAAQFMQVDNYIHSTIRAAMSESLPFIGEKE